MAATITEPKVITAGPYCVVGAYATYEGDDEGPAWSHAYRELMRKKDEVRNRVGDTLLGFLYRPHRDDPTVGEEVRACFVGVEVTDLDEVPEGLSGTRFSGGLYVTVDSVGDTEDESATGVGDAVPTLERWAKENGYVEGDACFCFSHELAPKPPFVEHVYLKIEGSAEAA